VAADASISRVGSGDIAAAGEEPGVADGLGDGVCAQEQSEPASKATTGRAAKRKRDMTEEAETKGCTFTAPEMEINAGLALADADQRKRSRMGPSFSTVSAGQ